MSIRPFASAYLAIQSSTRFLRKCRTPPSSIVRSTCSMRVFTFRRTNFAKRWTSFEKAQKLADEQRDLFAGPRVLGPVPRLQAIPLEEAPIRFQIGHVDLVVNATPMGLNRGEPSPIPARLLAPHVMVYDTIYSAERTPLVSASLEAGARGANGLSMLLHQGALAFEIWFQREAPIEVMRKAL